MATPPRVSRPAVASFVCGVTAVLVLVTLSEFFNYWMILAFALMYPTIGLGIGGLVQTRRQRPGAPLRGRPFAIIGLVIAGGFLYAALDFFIEFSQW